MTVALIGRLVIAGFAGICLLLCHSHSEKRPSHTIQPVAIGAAHLKFLLFWLCQAFDLNSWTFHTWWLNLRLYLDLVFGIWCCSHVGCVRWQNAGLIIHYHTTAWCFTHLISIIIHVRVDSHTFSYIIIHCHTIIIPLLIWMNLYGASPVWNPCPWQPMICRSGAAHLAIPTGATTAAAPRAMLHAPIGPSERRVSVRVRTGVVSWFLTPSNYSHEML